MTLEQTAEKGEPIFREAKVLVVDDLEKWLNDATNNLIYYGCKRENILWAYDVKNGERIYIAERPPVSLVDINFDVDNPEDTQGLSLIQKIKEIKSKGVVVAMSSLTDIESRTRDAGADYFIQKGKQFTANFDGFVEWYKKR
ncbi:MAG: response regulator [Nanoarchaeota archaeon]|nr:response regulator [Nanoarchaeota archaeon]